MPELGTSWGIDSSKLRRTTIGQPIFPKTILVVGRRTVSHHWPPPNTACTRPPIRPELSVTVDHRQLGWVAAGEAEGVGRAPDSREIIVNKKPFLATTLIMLVLLIATGCSELRASPDAATPTSISRPLPAILNHPKPDIAANMEAFKNAGCAIDDQEPWAWRCTVDSPITMLGCEQIEPDDLLGALVPSHPVAQCVARNTPPKNLLKYYDDIGCLHRYYISRVAFAGNAFRLINDESEFRSLFAPIESTNEALSYALVTTDLHASFDTKLDPHFKYVVEQVEDTHVEETPEGYMVHLYSDATPLCGCAIHTVSAFDVRVTKDGEIELGKSEPVYQINACFD